MALLVATAPKHLLEVADLNRGQLEEVLELATRMKTDPLGWRNTHAGGTIACVFREPSTRTRLSLAVAAQRLGMLPLTLGSDELQLGRSEPAADRGRLLSAYVDAIAVAGLAQVDAQRLSAAAAVPIINAQNDDHQPCQALADLLTIKERFSRIEGLKLAYVGGATDVAHSLM
jgi:ornithine carbamoyltransferase